MYTNSCCNFTIHVEEFLKFHNNTVIENYQIKNRLPRKLFALRINLFEFHITIWRTGLFLELFYACNYFCRHHVLLDIVNIFTTNVERITVYHFLHTLRQSTGIVYRHQNHLLVVLQQKFQKHCIEYVLMVLNVEHYPGHTKKDILR